MFKFTLNDDTANCKEDAKNYFDNLDSPKKRRLDSCKKAIESMLREEDEIAGKW